MAPEKRGSSTALRDVVLDSTGSAVLDAETWEIITGHDDTRERFRIYRLCECPECGGTGKVTIPGKIHGTPGALGSYAVAPTIQRCPECRGEGRTRQLVATMETPEAVGVALVTLGREGEFEECPVGLLETRPEGKTTGTWLIKPWLASPRNVSDAGKLLRAQR